MDYPQHLVSGPFDTQMAQSKHVWFILTDGDALFSRHSCYERHSAEITIAVHVKETNMKSNKIALLVLGFVGLLVVGTVEASARGWGRGPSFRQAHKDVKQHTKDVVKATSDAMSSIGLSRSNGHSMQEGADSHRTPTNSPFVTACDGTTNARPLRLLLLGRGPAMHRLVSVRHGIPRRVKTDQRLVLHGLVFSAYDCRGYTILPKISRKSHITVETV